MPDYKSMYYHLMGQTANTVNILEATIKMMEADVKSGEARINVLMELKEEIKNSHLKTEEMFVNSEDDN